MLSHSSNHFRTPAFTLPAYLLNYSQEIAVLSRQRAVTYWYAARKKLKHVHLCTDNAECLSPEREELKKNANVSKSQL